MKIAHLPWSSLGWALLCIGMVITVAMGVNVIGIELAGDIPTWIQWLDNQAAYFFVWRLCLYFATAYGWLRMRRRLYQRTPTSDARQRLFRAEISAIAVLVLLEISILLRLT